MPHGIPHNGTTWLPGNSNYGVDHRNPVAGVNSYYMSSYDPRQIDAARHTAMQLRSKSFPAHPVVSELALTNASLIEQWTELAESCNILSGRVVDANAKLQSATRDFEDVSYKLRQNGLTSTLGLLLSHKKSQLEDWQIDGSAGHHVNDEIKRFRSKKLENEGVKYDGSDIVRQTNAILVASGVDSNPADHAQLTVMIPSMLRERSDWLQMLTRGYNDHRQKLGELDSISTAFGKLIGD
ncbi:MAG: hypothetical protein ACK56W_16670, partial [Pirellula sp.]